MTTRHFKIFLAGLAATAGLLAGGTGRAASYFTKRLADPRAVYLEGPTGGDDTAVIQKAINQVQQSAGQGIVFVPEGRYRVSGTIYIWPGIRLTGYGTTRPVLALSANSAGFQDPAHEKVMIMFAGARPGFGRRRFNMPATNTNGAAGEAVAPESGKVPDANPGTFYSALANLDVEI